MARGRITVNRAAYPWRDVVSAQRWQTGNHARNSWSQTLTLSCGHSVYRKGSAGAPKRVRCTACPMVEHKAVR